MATRSAVITHNDDQTVTVTWAGLLKLADVLDVGAGVAIARYADKTVQAVGTFGAAGEIEIEGSNDGGTTWGKLEKIDGDVIELTTSAPTVIAGNPLLIRPIVAVGENSVTSLTVIMAMAVRGV